jgi:hypothetical protein
MRFLNTARSAIKFFSREAAKTRRVSGTILGARLRGFAASREFILPAFGQARLA